VLIVDNGSVEPATFTLFDRLTNNDSRVRILGHPGPFNYSALNNAAAREAEGEVLVLLNNDVGFDEVNLPVAYNDIDLCLRLGDYGYRVVWTPFAELFHLESASRGLDDDDPAKRKRSLRELEHMRKTWGSLLDSGDPFHNPNLLFSWERFEIPVWPLRRKPWRDLREEVVNLQRHFSRAQIPAIEQEPLRQDAK
jgi:glycosyltransferase involved in cell wall biosynthesis